MRLLYSSSTTVRIFLRQKENNSTAKCRVLIATRTKSGANDELKARLYNVICSHCKERKIINEMSIRGQGARLNYNESVLINPLIGLKLSDGRLENFERCWSLEM